MMEKIINFNVGVLGHIDSGKTSLAKALSTTASTACFDKNPQSRERGITLDLGFSSFTMDPPQHLIDAGCEKVQITLVDCPGHASLIRTIIGGSQIIDLMLLVVDVTKGMQTQTAECLVLGEITCPKMMIILNKIDLLPPENRSNVISKMSKKLQKTLEKTAFGNVAIIPVAAKPGGPEMPDSEALGLDKLISELQQFIYLPKRNKDGPFIFAVDHCFSIRGQGTVLTGTVLSGKIAVNDLVEIPSLKLTKKVKSMQMFRVPTEEAIQGDRVGICLTQFDPKYMERGLICAPNVLPVLHAAIISAQQISYFKGSIKTKAKFHVSIGHETVMAKVHFFMSVSDVTSNSGFDFDSEYMYLDYLAGPVDGETKDTNPKASAATFALLEFEKSVPAPRDCLVICSKLDSDIHLNTCRLAFQGKLLYGIEEKNYQDLVLPKLKIFKEKSKQGAVERLVNNYEVISRGLFKKETNFSCFQNLKVKFSTGEEGIIEGTFGQSGKVKIRIIGELKPSTVEMLEGLKKKYKGKGPSDASSNANETVNIVLHFRKYIYDKQKKIIQS